MSISYTNQEFHQTVSALRAFFLAKGFVEAHVQDRLSILAACEDPTNIASFQFGDQVWPLPQTGQMWLEHELLKSPSLEGVFCITTSYRLEKNPVPGRHNVIFPMFEFESKGGMQELLQLERELCEYLDFGLKDSFKEIDYRDAMKIYNVPEIRLEEEEMLGRDLGNVVMLKNFPRDTSPFWNMATDPLTGCARKVDVLIHGVETIGSAVRSCDPINMREQFHTISNGEYANLLYSKFGKDRVEAELEIFLNYDFFPRYGGGIGMTRLISALRKQALRDIPEFQMAG